jgi:hypothetical protein
MFEPMHKYNVRLSKKYFAHQHKNRSNFNAYKDYLRNLNEFKKFKDISAHPSANSLNKHDAFTVRKKQSRSPYQPIDLSPGKHELSEREIEVMALQGVFDFPHNKINDQLLENIDLKQADQLYNKKFNNFQK